MTAGDGDTSDAERLRAEITNRLLQLMEVGRLRAEIDERVAQLVSINRASLEVVCDSVPVESVADTPSERTVPVQNYVVLCIMILFIIGTALWIAVVESVIPMSPNQNSLVCVYPFFASMLALVLFAFAVRPCKQIKKSDGTRELAVVSPSCDPH